MIIDLENFGIVNIYLDLLSLINLCLFGNFNQIVSYFPPIFRFKFSPLGLFQ